MAKENCSIFAGIIKKCNLFSSPVNFRYQMEPVYNTLTGGLISIGLIVLLIGVFFTSWIELLNKESIFAVTEKIKEFDPDLLRVNTSQFMFAFGIASNDITNKSKKQYFDIYMEKLAKVNGSYTTTRISLEPCTQDHWKNFGEEFVKIYNRQKLNTFFCAPLDYTLELEGKFTSESFIYYRIMAYPCKGQNCYTKAQFDAYIARYTTFNFNFYYTNNLLNPEKRNPLSKFFDDKDYSMISGNLGAFVNLYMSEFRMETDESLLPFVDKRIEKGYLMNRGEKQNWDYVPTAGNPYARYYLRKSSQKFQITRRFRKIDEMLSYIGGLLGLVSVAFGLILNYYGQCAYQLELCEKIFEYKKKQQTDDMSSNQSESINPVFDINQGQKTQQKKPTEKQIHPRQFGFLDYLIYLIYYPLTRIFPQVKWERMEVYLNSLGQIRHKLDMGQLIEKLAFYDRAFNSLFDQDQLKLLYLQQKFNFDEVREERQRWQMRKILDQRTLTNLDNEVKQTPSLSDQCQLRQARLSIQQNSRRFQSFLGSNVIHPEQILRQDPQNKALEFSTQVSQALRSLQAKIQKGDIVSARIYNGLKEQILDLYEKKNKGERSKIIKFTKKLTKKKLPKVVIEKKQKMEVPFTSPSNLEEHCDSVFGFESTQK